MNESSHPTRLHELLADRALSGLTPEEEAELATLLAAHPEEDADAFDRAAAATNLALLSGKIDTLPAHLAKKIEAAALPKMAPGAKVVSLPERRDPLRFAGWIAAAACLAIAVLAIVTRKPQEPNVAIVVPPASGIPSALTSAPQLPTPPKTAAELR
ncbi:MAG: hypothetical protein ABI461_22445, partial [Polyangiaceae bacterium]